ncbi:MAG: galactokinase [Clostridia bacterium]|nr:galactokinase [Clostridia bacterium]
MINNTLLRQNIKNNCYNDFFNKLYRAEDIEKQKDRYIRVSNSYDEIFGSGCDVSVFSAPGRTEVCGNHTDHNKGRVLAASVNLDAIAVAAFNDDNIVRIKSEGYKMDVVDLSELEPKPEEIGKSVSLVRGVCAEFVRRGYKLNGFNAATASDVLSGSGVSSSAAFEVLVGSIINHLFNDGSVSAVEIAQIAQRAENVFFGKPCGLMDQMACSVGGFVEIDFKNPDKPIIEKVDFDFANCGHSLCIVNTGGSHSDLTDDYAAVRKEMEHVASCLGASVLRETDKDSFTKNIPEIRKTCGDRAVLRAMHFYADNERVLQESSALKDGDFEKFKSLVIESGHSSYMYNQNVFTCSDPVNQPVSLGLALCDKILKGKGAWRVHGGGFAGTIQAFVPDECLEEFKTVIKNVFGEKSCYVLSVRPVGGVKVI